MEKTTSKEKQVRYVKEGHRLEEPSYFFKKKKENYTKLKKAVLKKTTKLKNKTKPVP